MPKTLGVRQQGPWDLAQLWRILGEGSGLSHSCLRLLMFMVIRVSLGHGKDAMGESPSLHLTERLPILVKQGGGMF